MADSGNPPTFIIVRDRLSPLLDLIGWLATVGVDEIYLIDNDSSYPPLLEYLAQTPHHVVRIGHNHFGHRAPWLCGAVQKQARDRYFVVSDPDVVPDDQCPSDALLRFRSLLDRHSDIDKVGFGLRIDDLPGHYALKQAVLDWEARFWSDDVMIEPQVYRANIDTTFALYRPQPHHRDDRALRTGFPYVARHVPWYVNSTDPTPEDRFYREHADPITANWDQAELPFWKARWLQINASGPR